MVASLAIARRLSGSQSTPHPPSTMGRVWLEAATLAHTERAVPLSKIHSDLKNQPWWSVVGYMKQVEAAKLARGGAKEGLPSLKP